MKTARLLAVAAALPLSLVLACSGAPGDGSDGEGVDSTAEAISTSTIVSRGSEWVSAKLHYCQAAHGAVDFDSSCWGWEGPSHRCERTSNAAWNAYRSDCSGFVTFAWGLPAVGDGGYITSNFAPYGTSFSHTIAGTDLRAGDALNKKPDGHIILFKEWKIHGVSAVFMEEPGCSSSEPYAHEFTSNVSIVGDEVFVAYEGEWFYAIRYNGSTTAPPSSSSSSGGGSSSSSGGSSSGGSSAPDACSKGAGYCTETLQCDNGHWIVRQDDPHACTTVQNVEIPCSVGGGYCTATLQCENGHWVPRKDDPAACTSGPR
ncbi:MAG TPA: hypothetical protein VIF62_17715 [Labilithrix sp.]